MELDQIFRDLVSHPVAVEIVKSVFGETFIISNISANIARPGANSSMSILLVIFYVNVFYQNDIILIRSLQCRFIQTTISHFHSLDRDLGHECDLVPVRRDKGDGATLYIPGSNKYTSRQNIPENAPELLVPFEGKQGDVIIMDGRL